MMHETLLIIAKYFIGLVAFLGFIYWLRSNKEEKIRLLIFGAIAGIITILLVKIGGMIFYDPRPFVTHTVTPLYPHGTDNGFPSDHTALTGYIALTILSSSKRWGTALLILAIVIGISRVLGNIHSPIDIIGSLVFAVIAAYIATLATPRLMNIYTRRSRQDISANSSK